MLLRNLPLRGHSSCWEQFALGGTFHVGDGDQGPFIMLPRDLQLIVPNVIVFHGLGLPKGQRKGKATVAGKGVFKMKWRAK